MRKRIDIFAGFMNTNTLHREAFKTEYEMPLNKL